MFFRLSISVVVSPPQKFAGISKRRRRRELRHLHPSFLPGSRCGGGGEERNRRGEEEMKGGEWQAGEQGRRLEREQKEGRRRQRQEGRQITKTVQVVQHPLRRMGKQLSSRCKTVQTGYITHVWSQFGSYRMKVFA